jgi:hypothetical protein
VFNLAATGTEQGIAANNGSRYVAMGQGFFVQRNYRWSNNYYG